MDECWSKYLLNAVRHTHVQHWNLKRFDCSSLTTTVVVHCQKTPVYYDSGFSWPTTATNLIPTPNLKFPSLVALSSPEISSAALNHPRSSWLPIPFSWRVSPACSFDAARPCLELFGRWRQHPIPLMEMLMDTLLIPCVFRSTSNVRFDRRTNAHTKSTPFKRDERSYC